MSSRRSLGEASASDGGRDSAEDEEFLNEAFDELEEQDALARELARGGFFGDFDVDDGSDLRTSLRDDRTGSETSAADETRRTGGRSNAARMLEALEALTHEAEGGVPPSLRGLLEQLQSGIVGDGSVLGGMFPFSQLLQGAGTNPRFERMLEAIAADSPTPTQISGLSELCETLSLSTEEALAVSGFSVEKFVPAVVKLIRLPTSMDVVLLAARALSSILELYPSTAIPKAAAELVIPSLCEKLLEIEYMDVAELALQILERIVCKSEHALAASSTLSINAAQLCAQYRLEVIQENGIVALLQFVDFFPLEIQRRAARIVCQLCTNFPISVEAEMRQALPYITSLLRSFDSEILLSSFDCLRKLGESAAFSEDAAFASMVASDEICGILLEKLTVYASLDGSSGGSTLSAQLSPMGYTSMLRFLSCLLSCITTDMQSSSIAASASHLRFVRLPPIVTALLGKQEVVSENQLLREALKLVIVVLPITEELSSMEAIPSEMITLAHDILPLIIRVHDMTSRADLRYDCLGVIFRSCTLMYASQRSFTARERAELSRLAAFLARVLRPQRGSETAADMITPAGPDKDLLPIHLALRIIEVPLMHAAAREAATSIFERHGVVSVIRLYASSSKQIESLGGNLEEAQTTSARLVNEYLDSDSSMVSVATQLQQIAMELQTALTGSNSTNAQLNPGTSSLIEVLLKLRNFVAQGDDFMTAHEIACSGLVKVLIEVLSVSEGQEAFSCMLELQSRNSRGPEFVTMLVRCLQDAISAEKDSFAVDVSRTTDLALSSGNIVTDLDQLTQHIKVHVLIEEAQQGVEFDNQEPNAEHTDREEQGTAEESSLRWMKRASLRQNGSSYKANKRSVHDTVVLVEPLARIETMEGFIADKLFGRGRSGQSILGELSGHGAEGEEGGEGDESEEFANDVVKPRRVVAVYAGQVLPRDSSILEAIVKFGCENGQMGTGRPASAAGSPTPYRNRIWASLPHDITFRVTETPFLTDSSSACAGVLMGSDETTQNTKHSVYKSDSSLTGQSWDDVWDLLLLLKLVRNQCARMPIDTSLIFVNGYLSLQVRRALQQPVRVVTNSLPDWSFRLMNDFAFVLELETRCHFMYATTCGCSRAIQYLCRSVWKQAVLEEPATPQTRPSPGNNRRRFRDGSSRSRTSGLDNITRMVKLPRLKVRVARSRLLQSALKLLTIYGGKKAVIEIEFLGEVGTGLGPTTEFFTLVCQQIQSKQLQLWKDDDQVAATSNVTDVEQKRKTPKDDTYCSTTSLPIRGYHRVAVYHCPKCKVLHIPTCSVHRQLLTHEKKEAENTRRCTASDSHQRKARSSKALASARQPAAASSVPQCAQCLDVHDWHSGAFSCDCQQFSKANRKHDGKDDKDNTCFTLKWWVLSDEEMHYLAKVFPQHTKKVNVPVLQCAHCDTVNFPGTDAGIVEMDGNHMISRSGRRMFERDYRAVTKHVSPLCEGTPLNVMTSAITRKDVDLLAASLARSPEVLESEVESLSYLNETALMDGNIGGGPPVTAPFGLYPKPYLSGEISGAFDEAKSLATDNSSTGSLETDVSASATDAGDVLAWFTFLGRLVGQAILDERLLNLPFSRPFLRALRGEKMVGAGVGVEDSLAFVEELDPAIANSLRYLYDLSVQYAAKKELDGDTESEDIAVWADEVDTLCLAFTMVGADDIPLEVGGADISVTIKSLQRYVKLNLEFLLDRTIKCQVQAFKHGFVQICGGGIEDRQFFQAFGVRELESLLSDRGTGSTMWDRNGVDLREHMVCDHGYTADSRAIENLVSILCELTVDEQRLFVRFVTGANRLPLGGLRNLEPKLTVVRKLTESNNTNSTDENDAVLPSASTCTNYLKLPDYSTRDVMKQRLLYCINEGQCSFHLS